MFNTIEITVRIAVSRSLVFEALKLAMPMIPEGGFIMSVRSKIYQDVKVVVDDVNLLEKLSKRLNQWNTNYDFWLHGRLNAIDTEVLAVSLSRALNGAYVVNLSVRNGVKLSDLLKIVDV